MAIEISEAYVDLWSLPCLMFRYGQPLTRRRGVDVCVCACACACVRLQGAGAAHRPRRNEGKGKGEQCGQGQAHAGWRPFRTHTQLRKVLPSPLVLMGAAWGPGKGAPLCVPRLWRSKKRCVPGGAQSICLPMLSASS